MRVLTVNARSGTLKASWAEVDGTEVQVRSRITRESSGPPAGVLLEGCFASLADVPEQFDAVAHRLVHGADRFVEATRIDEAVEKELRALVPLAPLHLPRALDVIAAARVRFPGVPHVGVFDTAFHVGRVPESELYAVPPEGLADVAATDRRGFRADPRPRRRESDRVERPPRWAAQSARRAGVHLGGGIASRLRVRHGRGADPRIRGGSLRAGGPMS